MQQLADGTWSIAYEVVVTNTSATLPTTLLADRRARRSTRVSPSSRRGGRATRDVTDVAIEGGGTDTYTYVVTAESNETPVDPTALVCTPADGGGFFNTATVTFPGGDEQRHRMRRPGQPGGAEDRAAVGAEHHDRRLDAELRGVGVEPDDHPARVHPQRHGGARCPPV